MAAQGQGQGPGRGGGQRVRQGPEAAAGRGGARAACPPGRGRGAEGERGHRPGGLYKFRGATTSKYEVVVTSGRALSDAGGSARGPVGRRGRAEDSEQRGSRGPSAGIALGRECP